MSHPQISNASTEKDENELCREVLSLQNTVQRPPQHILALEALYPSFPKFGQLPMELRVMIWKYTYIPRVITMNWAVVTMNRSETPTSRSIVYMEDLCSSSFPISRQIPVSAVSKESRQIFEENYKRIDTFHSTESKDSHEPIEPIYINFSIDTILLTEPYSYDYVFGSIQNTKVLELTQDVHSLRHLAIYCETFFELFEDVELDRVMETEREPKSLIHKILGEFPHLEELIIYENEIPSESLRGGPHKLKYKDCKFVACGEGTYNGVRTDESFCSDPDINWEGAMVDILRWDDWVKIKCPKYASLRLNIAEVQQATVPGDYEPYYIKMGPANGYYD